MAIVVNLGQADTPIYLNEEASPFFVRFKKSTASKVSMFWRFTLASLVKPLKFIVDNFIELFIVIFLQYFIPSSEVGFDVKSINFWILGQFSILIVAKSTETLLPSSPYGKIMSVRSPWFIKLIDCIVVG